MPSISSCLSKLPLLKLYVGNPPDLFCGVVTPGVPYLPKPSMPVGSRLAVPIFCNSLNLIGSAIVGFCLPRTTTALRFFEPITAPIPVRPFALLLILIKAAKRTKFSPAGPICKTSIRLSSNSTLSLSSVSPVVIPHKCPASFNSASP